MLRSVIPALVVTAAALVSGCTTATIRAQEGAACSTNSSDDPQLVCTPALDLVCIATYSRMIMNTKEAAKFDGGIRQVFVCRLACRTTEDCPQSGDMDVCCPGFIHGVNYGKTAACVPQQYCETLLGPSVDAGAGGGGPDAPASVADTAANATPDAGAGAPQVDAAGEGG
jgi:hypothetical protein